MDGTTTYRVWSSMVSRCTNPRHPNWHRYGGRGISVCRRWRDFANFYADMGDKPPGRSLDRIDNDRGYEPGNCRWATTADQNANKAHSVNLSIGGVTKPLTEWARQHGLLYSTVLRRYRAGVPMNKLFSAPRKGRYFGRHPKAKLTAAQVRRIRAQLATGSKQNVLARRYEVSPSTIHLIAKGTIWKDP